MIPCDRCWKYTDVGKHKAWPADNLCGNCVRALLERGDYLPYKVVEGSRVYITEQEVFSNKSLVYNAEQWDEFMNLLDSPAKDNPRLKKLLTEPSIFE